MYETNRRLIKWMMHLLHIIKVIVIESIWHSRGIPLVLQTCQIRYAHHRGNEMGDA